jgi:alpha-glucosidase (family GH31 glycosyl hydrolase)
VAPVLDDSAREREVALPRGRWIETWSGETVEGGSEVVVDAPLNRIPVWVRDGSVVVTHPAAAVARGLGDEVLLLVATLWGEPPLGRAAARLADGTRIAWRRGRGWSVSDPAREVEFRVL